ncbi:cytochrome P450 3A6 [Rhipicephalus sanguineus]|uniref:cytochrome P450 3A6 n=1 Tax=Rhipicephalus sanguineus TaxID=34632 RepID=UPI0020C3A6DA|nr:cytochrome P450 3A6 [Rhipicephalus sanguineus]
MFKPIFNIFMWRTTEAIGYKWLKKRYLGWIANGAACIPWTTCGWLAEAIGRGEKWRKVRSVFNACFTAGKVKTLCRSIDGTVTRLVQKFDDAGRFGDVIDAHEAARCMVLETLTRTVLGRQVDCQANSDDATLKSFEVIFREVDDALVESAFAYPGLYSILQLLYPFTSFSKAVQKIMDDALITLNKRRSGEEARREDVLQHVIDAQEGVGNILPTARANVRCIDDHTLVCNLAILILAGYDTTSASLAFLLYLLAKHPEEQLKIRAELVSALHHKEDSDRQAFSETERTATTFDGKQNLERKGWQPCDNVPGLSPPHTVNDVASEATSSNADAVNKELDEDDVMQLQRLDMVVREGLRLYPTIPINVMRECMEDTTILGQFIPAGTSIFAPPWHIHRNADIWPEPDRFLPERFSPEHRDNVASSYYPFGLGPRTCVAHRLAMVTLKTALYRIVRNFDISLAEDLADPLPVCVHNIVLNPAVAIKLKVTRTNI